MASLNKVFLIGNLTQDPELRRLPTGTAVATLRLAVNESFQSKGGERQERTLYVDVDVWERQAETCQQYLSKGSPVFVEGRLQMDQWTDKESGQTRSRMKIRAERVQFLSSRRDGQGGGGGYGGGGYGGGGAAQAPAAPDYGAVHRPSGDEDVPC